MCVTPREVAPMWREMFRKSLGIAFLLGGIALLPAGLPAQLPKTHNQGPGNLDGTVIDSKGTPVAGAQILWQASDGEKPHVVHSDAQGHFHLAALRAGLYDLRASAGDASSDWEHNVVVRRGAESNVKLRLVSTAPPAQVVLELKGKMRTWDVPLPGALPHDPAVD